MIRVAIVDDEAEVLDLLERNISNAFKMLNVDVTLHKIQNGKELIELHKEKEFNIIFLDLEMPEMDGLETARFVCSYDQNAVLIFVTNREDLVFDAFQYNAIAFIRKKRLKEELSDAVRRAYNLVATKLTVHLFKTEFGDIRFQLNEILYFSSHGHNVWLHHMDGKAYRIFYTLEQIENLISNDSFIKCHSGVLANCGFIYSIDKENVILTNGEAVALSRHRRKDVKEALQKYLRSL